MPAQFRIKIRSRRKRKPPSRLRSEYKREVQNTLRKIGAKGINNIKHEIRKRDLINSGNMLNSVGYRMTPQGVRFEVRTDYASYVNAGVRRHQMIYLTKAEKPIPIDAANGIFRWASPQSMQKGKWVHPGFKRGKDFLEDSVTRTRKDLKKEIEKIEFKVFRQ